MGKIIFYLVKFVFNVYLRVIKAPVYRIFFKKLGKRPKINLGSQVASPWNVEIGDNFIMNTGVVIEGQGGVKIGNNVLFGYNVIILSTAHPYNDVNLPMSLQGAILKNVEIGNDVWLGANVVVMPGIKIGDGVVVGANSVVTRNIEPYAIYGGVPARLIRSRILSNSDGKDI
jgi:acetyltransferase-like isoleucine patch superfamily enzyme